MEFFYRQVLSDGEKILKICLFVSTKSTNVTDRRTDEQTDTAWRLRPRLHSIARKKSYTICTMSVSKKNVIWGEDNEYLKSSKIWTTLFVTSVLCISWDDNGWCWSRRRVSYDACYRQREAFVGVSRVRRSQSSFISLDGWRSRLTTTLGRYEVAATSKNTAAL